MSLCSRWNKFRAELPGRSLLLTFFPLLSVQATLRIKNSNFYSVTVTSLTSQVQYMNTVVGTQQISSVSSIQPLSDKLVFTFPYNHHQIRYETWALLRVNLMAESENDLAWGGLQR